VGYLGSLRLAVEIISAIQERQDRDAPRSRLRTRFVML